MNRDAAPSCQLPQRLPGRLSLLSPGERLVTVHVAQGLSNKEISSALGRTVSTVKRQLSGAMVKLGVQSRCQLIVLLLRR